MFLPAIDSLMFSALTRNYNTHMEQLNPTLETMQDYAKLTNKNAIITIGTEEFELYPNGARLYKYILHNSKYEIKLQQVHNENSSNFPIYIRLKSEFLWAKRSEAYHESIKYIESILGQLEEIKISRADLCCHTDQIQVDKLKIDRFITRSKAKEEYYQPVSAHETQLYRNLLKVNGLAFGRSPIRLRIYDKTLEIIQSSKKTWFQDIWKEHGVNPNATVTNVEFQLNREFFKLHNINTFEEFDNEIKTIWQYLTHEWTRYVNSSSTRLKRCHTTKTWKNIQAAFDEDWKSINGISRDRQKQVNREHLLNLIRCYMINDAAHIGKVTFFDYVKEMVADVDQLMQEKHLDFEQEVLKKMGVIG